MYDAYSYKTKNKCIICGTEFESSRRARFCQQAKCRQAYNRQERAIKAQGEAIKDAVATLLANTSDPNLGKLAKDTLFDAEKSVINTLDEHYPDRHPKKEITAIPIKVTDPQTYEGKVFAFGTKTIGGLLVHLTGKAKTNYDGSWVEGQIRDGWRTETILLSDDCLFIRLEEPETDKQGREIIEKYNPGWGAVVNPNRQIEIAPIPDGDDEEYSDEEEEWE